MPADDRRLGPPVPVARRRRGAEANQRTSAAPIPTPSVCGECSTATALLSIAARPPIRRCSTWNGVPGAATRSDPPSATEVDEAPNRPRSRRRAFDGGRMFHVKPRAATSADADATSGVRWLPITVATTDRIPPSQRDPRCSSVRRRPRDPPGRFFPDHDRCAAATEAKEPSARAAPCAQDRPAPDQQGISPQTPRRRVRPGSG